MTFSEKSIAGIQQFKLFLKVISNKTLGFFKFKLSEYANK